ncbi:MAG: hypothetical protein K2R98_09325 [Gemmataceae bacterium]|nr:hypothetical protein [Gemmataceae bacterium]
MSSAEDVRAELVRLLEGEEEEAGGWRIVYTALNQGRQLLPTYKNHYGAYAIQAFILDRLRDAFPMHPVELGSGETAWVMNNADGKGLYVKLTIAIEDDMAVVLSFHTSKHDHGD